MRPESNTSWWWGAELEQEYRLVQKHNIMVTTANGFLSGANVDLAEKCGPLRTEFVKKLILQFSAWTSLRRRPDSPHRELDR